MSNIEGGNIAETIAGLANVAHGRDVVLIEDAAGTTRTAALVLAEGQSVHEFDLAWWEQHPDRKAGQVQVSDAGSLCEYVKRHLHQGRTTIWAHDGKDQARVRAVLNDHEMDADEPGQPGWGDHEAVLTLAASADWLLWASLDQKWVDQDTFAEHLEAAAASIVHPPAARMLEVAEAFHVTSGSALSSTRRLSGEVEFAYTGGSKASASGGRVPTTFTIRVAPFVDPDCPVFELTARLRYRTVEQSLRLGYRLIRPDVVRDAAFTQITTLIGTEIGLPVLRGTPRSIS